MPELAGYDWKKESQTFDTVAETIERHGGRVEKPYLAVLFTAKKM